MCLKQGSCNGFSPNPPPPPLCLSPFHYISPSLSQTQPLKANFLPLSLSLSLSLFTDSLSHSLQTLSSSLSLSLPFVPFIFPVTQNAPELGIFPAPRPQNPVFPRWDTPKKPKRQNGGTFCAHLLFCHFYLFFPFFLRFLGKKGASLRGRCHIYIYIYIYIYTYIYIYIYIIAVELLSGPSLALLEVIIWSKFVFFYKTPIVKKNTIKLGFQHIFLAKNCALKNWKLLSGPSWRFLRRTQLGPDNNFQLGPDNNFQKCHFFQIIALKHVLKYLFI